MKRLSLLHSSQVSRLSELTAADRSAVGAEMVLAGRQRDLRAQVGGRDLEPEVAVMLGHRLVHRIDEDDVRLAGRKPGLDQLLEQRARVDLAALAAVLRAAQDELGALADRLHELVGYEHAVVEVQGLAVKVAARFPDLEELLDLGVSDVEVASGRAAAERALADRQRQAVHHPHERNDAAGLAVEADRLADPAHPAPVGADAAALGREPDILVPDFGDRLEAVVDAVEIAADRQAAAGAAVAQHRGRRHEPQLRDVIVDALRVCGIVGISRSDAREQILVALARQQIAVAQRVLAELGQQSVAAVVGDDIERAVVDRFAGARGRRNVVARDFLPMRKIHCASPSFDGPVEDRLFANCSTRSHDGHPSLFRASTGLFSCLVPVEIGDELARHRNIVIPAQNTRC